jgi:hypothetical protein
VVRVVDALFSDVEPLLGMSLDIAASEVSEVRLNRRWIGWHG